MTQTDWIGFTGVSILLMAFLLNLFDKMGKDGFSYLIMNFVGAGMACLASILLKYLPFIILEGSWTLVSAFGLLVNFNRYRYGRRKRTG